MAREPATELSRFEPDLGELGELQRAFWRRAFWHGVPALVALMFCVVLLPAVAFAGVPWWMIMAALPVGAGALVQLAVLWLDRPASSAPPMTLEVGAGMLRFVDEKAGTVEEVRWRQESAVSVRRANESVEITLPSGRRNRVHWFAYANREDLLKALLALEQPAEAPAPPAPASSEPPKAEPTAKPAAKAEAAKPEPARAEGKSRRAESK